MNAQRKQILSLLQTTPVKILLWSALIGSTIAPVLIFLSPRHFNSNHLDNQAFTPPKRLLVVFAHADDEITNAGLIHHWATSGTDIRLLTLTDGSANPDSDLSTCETSENIIRCRLRELQTSAQALGVQSVKTPQLPDAKLMENLSRAIEIVRDEIGEFQPDSVLTMEPSGLNGLSDHRAAFLSVARAVAPMNAQTKVFLSTLPPPFSWILHSEIPDSYASQIRTIPLTSKLIEVKSQSALAHRSQASTIQGLTLGLGPRKFFSWIDFETYGVFQASELAQLIPPMASSGN